MMELLAIKYRQDKNYIIDVWQGIKYPSDKYSSYHLE